MTTDATRSSGRSSRFKSSSREGLHASQRRLSLSGCPNFKTRGLLVCWFSRVEIQKLRSTLLAEKKPVSLHVTNSKVQKMME